MMRERETWRSRERQENEGNYCLFITIPVIDRPYRFEKYCHKKKISEKEEMIQRLLTLSLSIVLIHVCSKINAQQIPLCESLIASDTQQNEAEYTEVKIRRVRAICDAIYSSQSKVEENDLNSIPEFDMKQIESGNPSLMTNMTIITRNSSPFRSRC